MSATEEQAPARGSVTTAPEHVRVPSMLQQAATECGAASLGMVLAHYGRWVTLDELRLACGVDRNGAALQDVANAAEKYGLAYEDKDIINNPANYQEMVMKSGQTLQPTLEIDGKILADAARLARKSRR